MSGNPWRVPIRGRDDLDITTSSEIQRQEREAAWDEGYQAALEAQAQQDDAERQAYWRAGFLRGAKFWYGRTQPATMWQSEQNECWAASLNLWPPHPMRIMEAQAVVAATILHAAESAPVPEPQ